MTQNITHSINLFVGANQPLTSMAFNPADMLDNKLLTSGSQSEVNSLPNIISGQSELPMLGIEQSDKGSSLLNIVKDTLTGLIPGMGMISDIKDIYNSTKKVINGDFGSILNLGKSIIGVIPGIGDIAKGLLGSLDLGFLSGKKSEDNILGKASETLGKVF